MPDEKHPAIITDVGYLDDFSLFGVSLNVQGYDDDGDHSYYLSLNSSERESLKRRGRWEDEKEIIEKIEGLEEDVDNDSEVEITVLQKEDGTLDRIEAIEEVTQLLKEY